MRFRLPLIPHFSHTPPDKPLATQSLRVLIVTGIFPPDIGGPATYVPSMAGELVKRGHRVRVVTLSDRLDHDDGSYAFPVRRIRRGLFKPWRFLLTVAAILREGRQAQVLYVNGLYLEAVVANWFARKPMVQKIVGDWAWERAANKGWTEDNFEEFQKRRHEPKVGLLKALRTFCVRRADTIIAPSRYLARAVAGWGVAGGKITVVYNAVETPAAAQPLPIPLTTRVNIGTASRLIPLKQIDHLIAALKDCDGMGLVIIGDGPERERLEDIALANRVAERVYFAGQLSQKETVALMSACDLFVLNSTHEGFSHVILEAMSVGLPVVATAVGGTPELVRDGENGVLIAPNSNGALAKTLRGLVASVETRRRLTRAGLETARQFVQATMIESTEGVLNKASDLGQKRLTQ